MPEPTPTLTAEQRVTAVLAAHCWGDDTERVGHHAMQCGCGWKAYETGSIYTLRERHDTHRAEALARMVADAEQRGRAEVSAAVEAVLKKWSLDLDGFVGYRSVATDLRAVLADPAAVVARIKAEAGCELQRSGDGTHGPLIRQAKAEARKQALRESANEVHIEARFQTELMVRQGPEPHRYLTDRLSILETILRDRADRIDGTP